MMGSYLARTALTLAGSYARPRLGALEEARLPLRVWPTDLDTYGHVNNGRYLTLMDMGRLEWGLRTGLAFAMLKRRWYPVLGAASVEFRRELRAFQRCELVTKLAAWDDKWFYFEQHMEHAGQVHARAVVRGVTKQGRRTVPPSEILATLEVHSPSPLTPAQLPSFLAPSR
ncbi:acyl-CoA thioesterase [Myxococcaceae bacterium GXIMD 01537]